MKTPLVIKGNFKGGHLGIQFSFGSFIAEGFAISKFVPVLEKESELISTTRNLTNEVLEEWFKFVHTELDKFLALASITVTEGVRW